MRTGQPAPYDALVLYSARTADFDIGSVERVLGNAPRVGARIRVVVTG